MMSECVSEVEIRQFLNGELNGQPAQKQISDHLSQCDSCRSSADALRPDSKIDSDQSIDTATVVMSADERVDNATNDSFSTDPHSQYTSNELLKRLPPGEQDEDLGQLDSYRILSVLGRGGMGTVFRAMDTKLDRLVAVKCPHRNSLQADGAVDRFLSEAKLAASIDHPHIVPVYGFGQTEDLCFIVSKLIEGTSLAERAAKHRFSFSESVILVSKVASALQHAHTRGVYHRDVKSQNILLDAAGEPHLTDFGLAVHESSLFEQQGLMMGTLAYMPPEQTRGEGHRIDGRSDVYSLGVVLYELLCGRRPFKSDSTSGMFDQILHRSPPPPRQLNNSVPTELERICLKCLAKQMTSRYGSASDLVDDLQHWLDSRAVAQNPSIQASMSQIHVVESTLSGQPQPLRIVPKGLRSFDAHDSDFFLELLPGPRDRDGLPDSIRFWKRRIEESDADDTFAVGLIYGPSGCGKSSLVKAGLLPRLSDNVTALYVEATPEDTESRLLRSLQKCFPALETCQNLKETLNALRRGHNVPSDTQVLIVIDQFEQWLHTKREQQSTELVEALRQCDGGRLQCIVMVRDDFWLAVSRFLRELEIKLVEGGNSALADLFDLDHARRVLAAFGRAFGKLPEDNRQITQEQNDFLEQAVSGLAEEGKVICVRLALFAEMMKSKAWTAATLNQLGGTQGVGITFLEETFSATAAPPEHRFHQKAARAVLRALLPDSGTDIKGHMRSYSDLLNVSGYQSRPQDFDDLIRLLDSEIRLITPTDPEGKESGNELNSQSTDGQKYFQLTHDYLVRPLRDWLTRKQKETRRGRAELLLNDRSMEWNIRPENRFLPSWQEYLTIRMLTERKKWSEPQQLMMSKASGVHLFRSSLIASLILIMLIVGNAIRNRMEARHREATAVQLVEGLLKADTAQVTTIIDDLTDYQTEAEDDLKRAFEDSLPDSNARLHAALAMLAKDEEVLPYLTDRLLSVTAAQFAPVVELLQPAKPTLIPAYMAIARNESEEDRRRFRAACALASYDAENEFWQNSELNAFVADHLVRVLPSELLPWRNALRPVQQHLTGPLSAVYRDTEATESVRKFATITLIDYLSDDFDGLVNLLADADEQQYLHVIEKLLADQKRAVECGIAELNETAPADISEDAKETVALRKANVATMLLRMNAAERVWPLLKHSTDPRIRSYIIHGLSPRGVLPETMMARYELETDVTVKRALLLCLGEFRDDQFKSGARKPLTETLLEVFRTATDPGLRAAAEWLLRKWGKHAEISKIVEQLRMTEDQLATTENGRRQWYVNTQGQTFSILDVGEFLMGSPNTEPRRLPNELLHTRRIDRRIAVSATEVTRGQWRAFEVSPRAPTELFTSVSDPEILKYCQTDDSPMIAVTWYEAAQYCNWLSQQEGIPVEQWCYEPNPQARYGPGMRAKDDFWELTGYRLPTEAEWEFACRAGSSAPRYYGATETLFSRYAWHQQAAGNRVHPVASLKPNDFGLFDMYGNAFEWCYGDENTYASSATQVVLDTPHTDSIFDADRCPLRGGGFYIESLFIRSAQRKANQPGFRDSISGLRPVRTYRVSK